MIPRGVRVGQRIRLQGRGQSALGGPVDVYVLLCDESGLTKADAEEYLVDPIANARGAADGVEPLLSLPGVVLAAAFNEGGLSRGDELWVDFVRRAITCQRPDNLQLTVTHGDIRSIRLGGKGEYYIGTNGESPKFYGPLGGAASNAVGLRTYEETDVSLELHASRLEIRLVGRTPAQLQHDLTDWLFLLERHAFPSRGSAGDRERVAIGARRLGNAAKADWITRRFDRFYPAASRT